jgi:hypothetical protein
VWHCCIVPSSCTPKHDHDADHPGRYTFVHALAGRFTGFKHRSKKCYDTCARSGATDSQTGSNVCGVEA